MSYVIAGRRILNEHLALGVYALTGVGAYLAMSGDSKPKAIEKPVAANSSSEEADFIKNFIANLEKEDAAAAKH